MSDIPHCTGCGEYPGDLVADRIKELQAQRNFAQRQVVFAEAKLAKAVEALGRLVYLQSGGPCTGIQSEQWLSEARTTLAELAGGKDD